MNTRKITPLVLAALLAAGGTAYARDRDHDQDVRDTAALDSMKVTLQQAIATAEQQSGGRAVGADVSQERGAPSIAVEVAGPEGVRTVLVDGQSGQVMAILTGGQDGEDDD